MATPAEIQPKEDTYDLYWPYNPPKDAEEWTNFLRHLPVFSGDLNAASAVMDVYSQAGDYVVDELRARGMKGIFKPPIGVSTRIGSAYLSVERMVQFVGIDNLEKWSKQPLDTPWYAYNAKDELTFIGALEDLIRLIAIEETHHGIFYQIKEFPEDRLPPSRLATTAEYHADIVEFRALKWVARYAKARHMPEETVSNIEDRLTAARSIRLSALVR